MRKLKMLIFNILLNNQVLKNLSSGIKPGIRKSDVMNIEISIPPKEFQQDIVRRLDLLDLQLKSLETSIEQSKDNAKFILESYLK